MRLHSNIKLKEKNWDSPMGRFLQPSVIHEATALDKWFQILVCTRLMEDDVINQKQAEPHPDFIPMPMKLAIIQQNHADRKEFSPLYMRI